MNETLKQVARKMLRSGLGVFSEEELTDLAKDPDLREDAFGRLLEGCSTETLVEIAMKGREQQAAVAFTKLLLSGTGDDWAVLATYGSRYGDEAWAEVEKRGASNGALGKLVLDYGEQFTWRASYKLLEQDPTEEDLLSIAAWATSPVRSEACERVLAGPSSLEALRQVTKRGDRAQCAQAHRRILDHRDVSREDLITLLHTEFRDEAGARALALYPDREMADLVARCVESLRAKARALELRLIREELDGADPR